MFINCYFYYSNYWFLEDVIGLGEGREMMNDTIQDFCDVVE